MGPRPNHLAFALPRALRQTITQVDVANYFAEANSDFDDDQSPAFYYAFCARTKSWHRAESTSGDWCYPRWSDAREFDPLPALYARIIRIIRPLTEQSSETERQRCLSHGFIAGVIRLLQHDERIVCEPWELHHPPKPVREAREAAHDAKMRRWMAEQQVKEFRETTERLTRRDK
jgi:hypothetical protein